MYPEPVYQLALTRVPQIGCVLARALAEQFGTAGAVFGASRKALTEVDGISHAKASHIRGFRDFGPCEAEWGFLQKHGIRLLFVGAGDYPRRLLHSYDPPTVLFYKGEADLNTARMLAVIGTRTPTEYGKQLTESLIEELAGLEVTIVSGMAFGIDTLAHKASMRAKLPTVGVLAHGLDTMYPQENARLARQMMSEGGGLLSEYWSGTEPDKHHFPTRNRVVAGLCDATVVVETDLRGGSLITAEYAINYHRDVFAFPGPVHEAKSRGCHQLIRQNKAALITSAADLVDAMGWKQEEAPKATVQRALFVELSPEEKALYDLLQQGPLHIDELKLRSRLGASAAASALLSLELQGVAGILPGNMYRLL